MNRSSALKLAALALMVAAPLAASAQDARSGLSYNYVQGGYVRTNTDNADADGWGLGGSVAVHPNFHLFGNYSTQEVDHVNIDVDQWRLGAGYNRSISDRTDFVGTVAYEKFDAGSADLEGYSLEAGVRSSLAPAFEGYALAGYEDGDQYDGDFYGRLGGTVKFNPNWGVNADVKIADGDTQWFVGPRFTW